jgi:hypothetical protein
LIWHRMVPQLSRVMLGITGCRIQPDPLTANLTSSCAPHSGQLTGAFPSALRCLHYRHR